MCMDLRLSCSGAWLDIRQASEAPLPVACANYKCTVRKLSPLVVRLFVFPSVPCML